MDLRYGDGDGSGGSGGGGGGGGGNTGTVFPFQTSERALVCREIRFFCATLLNLCLAHFETEVLNKVVRTKFSLITHNFVPLPAINEWGKLNMPRVHATKLN